MGRRSTKTTKTGKFMNPTDQWRKQCRKKELKKNKVQRTAVREAVIKSKNPQQLLAEIEEIEKMEIEAGGEEIPSDKGLKEKKRKLHETLQRIVDFYEKEDYNKAQQIKTFIVESERRRRAMTTVYSSYKTARSQYNVSDIPLPDGPNDDEESFTTSHLITDIPLPEESAGAPPRGLLPPGPPPGPPPDIVYPKASIARPKRSVQFTAGDEDTGSEDDDDDDDDGSDDSDEGSDTSGENSDDSDIDDKGNEDKDRGATNVNPQVSGGLPSSLRPPGPPPGLPPPGINYPPPLFPPPSQPPRHVNRFSMVPPSMQPRPLLSSEKPSPHFQSSPIISNDSQLKSDTPTNKSRTATISAQPQIRNVQAEVTKFLPTSLRVRRDNPRQIKQSPIHSSVEKSTKPKPTAVKPSGSLSKGDAYDAFMKEMQGLL